jgi:hypothetical protein
MCCKSPEATFAWMGAILINIGFVSLISWGAASNWPVGFTLCGLYAILLLRLAMALEPKPKPTTKNTSTDTDRKEEEAAGSTTGSTSIDYDDFCNNDLEFVSSSPRSTDSPAGQEGEEHSNGTILRPGQSSSKPSSILISLLYGLAIVAMATTGLFIPVNMLNCSPGAASLDKWITDWSSLPKDVQSSLETTDEDFDYYDGSSFVFLPASGITLFSGTNGSDSSRGSSVWIIDSSTSPSSSSGLAAADDSKAAAAPRIQQGLSNPVQFTRISDSVACLVTESEGPPVVTCFDGMHFRGASTESTIQSPPYSMFEWHFVVQKGSI